MRTSSGEIQFTTVLTVLGVATVGYFAWALLPAIADNYTAKQTIGGVVNQGWKRSGKEAMHKETLEKLSAIGTHIVQPPGGQPVEVKGLPVDDDSIVVVCTDQRQDCSDSEGEVTITVTYTRVVPLPYLKGKSISLHFAPSAKETLKPAAW